MKFLSSGSTSPFSLFIENHVLCVGDEVSIDKNRSIASNEYIEINKEFLILKW